MKKIFLSFLAVICLFTITACGNNKSNEGTGAGEESNEESADYELEMYSDDTKIVFEYSNIKYVFYYKGDTITGYETYLKYDSVAAAKYALELLNAEDNDTVKKAYLKGKYLVVEYNESEYEDLTPSTLRLAYSYMKEVTK